MKRTVSLLLAILSCLLLLAACNGNGGTGEPTQAETEAPVTHLDRVPELDFGGEKVKVLTWTEQAEWDWVENAELAETIDSALFRRQENIQSRFNVEFEVIKREGAWASRESYVNTIRMSIENDTGYDLIASHPSSAAAATVAGYFKDLNTVPYIDHAQPWWPDDIWNTCQINEHLYFATGDISSTAIRSISCMILNLNIYNSLGFEESIYDIVERGEWTMEKFKSYGIDLMGDYLNGEAYGITIGSNVEFDNLFYGAGFRYVTVDESDGLLMLSDDVMSENLDTWFGIVQDLFTDHDDVAITPIDAAFTSGYSLWFLGYLSNVQEYLSNVTFDFAVVPYPKYDSKQTEYKTVNGWWLTMYSVPTNLRSPELSGALLEALGSEGARIVTPAVYEASFKYRYLRTEKNAIMFDLLHDTLVFDAGRIFCDQLDKIGYAFRQASDDTVNWVHYRDERYDGWDRALRGVLRSFA